MHFVHDSESPSELCPDAECSEHHPPGDTMNPPQPRPVLPLAVESRGDYGVGILGIAIGVLVGLLIYIVAA